MMESFLGQVRLTACNNFDPAVWMPCDGRLLQISNLGGLYSLIGTFYGGDGVTTFALPDMRDRFVIGSGDSNGPGLPAASYKEGQHGGERSLTTVLVDPYPAAGAAPTAITLTDPPFKTTNVPVGAKIPVNNVGAGPLISSNIDVATVVGNTVTALATGTAIILSASLTGGANLTVAFPPIAVLLATAQQDIAPASLGLIYVFCVNGAYPARNY